MRLLTALLLTTIGGIAGHLTRPIVRREFVRGGRYDGWFAIASYTLGVLFALPFIVWTWRNLDRLDGESRLVSAYLLAFGAFGAGTVFGHWLLPDGEEV